MSEERTERASPRRRQQAAEKGDRVRSRELVSAAAMVAGVLTLGALVERWAAQWRSVFATFLALGTAHHGSLQAGSLGAGSVGPGSMGAGSMPGYGLDAAAGLTGRVAVIREASLVMLSPMLLLFAAVTAAALFAGLAQGGGAAIHAGALALKWERLSPAQNFRNLLSLRGLARLLKSLLPVAVLLIFAIHRIAGLTAIPPLSAEQVPGMLKTSYAILLDTAWILFAWSAVDYLVEWRSWESRQKMSKQEVREEQKQTEGSPQVRGRIKSLRRQLRRRQLRADISRATVVITNPAHYAVALSFDFETMEPPKMVAKGRDLLAARIKEEARWAGIPIVENPPLARSLYRHLEPGRTIPHNLYAAVAAILAFLYRQRVEESLKRDRAARQAAAARAETGSPGGVSPRRDQPAAGERLRTPREAR
jgi:flagellar biosynthetic protein FlhB